MHLTLIYCHVPPNVAELRFESSETDGQSKTDLALREELLVKLLDRKLLGPTHQVFDMDPSKLPLRELPPGNVSGLYLMFLAYLRPSGETPPSKSTFYSVWKEWSLCLRFRHPSEHTMCVQCQTLKAAIRASTVSCLQYSMIFDFGFTHLYVAKFLNDDCVFVCVCAVICLRTIMNTHRCATSYSNIIMVNGWIAVFTGQPVIGASWSGIWLA